MDPAQRPRMAPPGASQGQKPAVPQLEQINAEIFTFMYGSIIRQLITDFEDMEEVNKQLEQMGYNIGIRLIDEFLAKSKITRCTNFKETVDVIAKQAFPMFLSMSANATNWSQDGKECSLVFTDNPFTEFVELPEEYRDLKYLNLVCGVLRGALEQVSMDIEAKLTSDMLKGDDSYEIRVRLREHRDERFPYKEDD
uniref:Trafficking protein particle complex subunit n=1 Tax=Chlamydomonas leiostraca TaxID=1034604 RepID=A0A7S0RI19_9CHLO|mmetsp:Transcript_22689/g.57803  ORF Transcript_22689/g.57803 Transcript_22689/m.57803 type:complete len:196 (+) Transcript_22689:35-622(+)|eukprot:CAMPEP_0202865284 /NCGR_PEP_ID=MMETSP1391-20130828/5563_1 /ASSEMBLY_ACC=CAM_ASM_000867 /TAXON_ID=1034604 /ORGANISM="Chlamydomonas leiostraca, Strain SAG 11-49" /LENGTH=195 /DNA_ID=CAMNT_0049545107 /DNA_START=36 /DNA_END=623 /DNA_ORIENTATION=-